MWPLAAYTGGRRRAPTASGGSNPIPATTGPAICRAFVFQEIFQPGYCVRVLTPLYSVSVEVALSTNDGDERLREGMIEI
jgi:hypothetical protein